MSQRIAVIVICCLAGGLFLVGMPCLAAEFEVDRTDDVVDAAPGDGKCAAAPGPGCSLRAAIQEANALPGPDIIFLPAGTYILSLAGADEDAAVTGDLDITDAVSIVGAGPEATIVDAAALDRVMDMLPADLQRDVELADLTLRNGDLDFAEPGGGALGGAALRVGPHVHLALHRVTLRDSRATVHVDAVGISNRGCITGEQVRILHNLDPKPTSIRPRAGGVYTEGADSCLTLVDSELRGNRGDNAGAIYAEQGAPVTLRRTLIADNESRFSGAMLLNSNSTVMLENVTISGNRGQDAILNDGGSTLTLINSTVTDNRGRDGFEAIVGGIHDVHGGFGLTFISNTILSGNGPGFLSDDCRVVHSLDGGNIIGDSARCNAKTLPSDQLDVDPGLQPLADNGGLTATHLPGPNAIDHGVASACAATDQRGVARPLDGDGDGEAECDVGAVEQLGEAGSPLLTFEPASLDLGDVEVGSTGPPQTATLENSGDAAATGLVFSVLGSGFDADTGGCGASLLPEASCEVGITFTPSEAGKAAGTLEVDSDEGPSANLDLAGNGFTEPAVFDAAGLDVDTSAVVSDGNGVLEPGESVEVAPAWRNDGTGAGSVSGAAADLTGPEGAVYSLVSDEADYGSIDPGQAASCQETEVCYQMGVSDPAVRPAPHWEATFQETLSDDTVKTWTLHIGDSFADVHRSNLFYPSIETLLHRGITGGCNDSDFCPTATSTRAQMPVFVLRALEGADYAPPACEPGSQGFADVPSTSPFCPWIEELAARGVVAGCGNGAYCPTHPVTRAQMAVFLLRALEGSGYVPPACNGIFADVTCPSTFADWVEELYHLGITGGCGTEPLRYCPDASNTRGQMAVFLSATFELSLYGP